MACQKITQTRKGEYTKLHPFIFLTPKHKCSVKDVGMDKTLYIYIHFYILPSLFV